MKILGFPSFQSFVTKARCHHRWGRTRCRRWCTR